MKNTTWIYRTGLVAGALTLSLSLSACARSNSDAAPTGSSSAAAAADGPRIEFEEKVHDFGNVTEGDTLKHTFKVKNTGTAPLEIAQIRTSCGCTAAVTKDKSIPPGGSTEIEVTFDTRGRMGPNRKTITVQCNDKDNASARVEIKAMIERLLAFTPTVVRISASHGEEKSVEAWLTGKLSKNAKLEVAEVTGETGVKTEVVEKKEGEETKRGVRFTFKGQKVGLGNGTVKLKTGVEEVAELTLRFTTSVTGNVQLRPRALYFDDKNPRGKERVLRVTSTRNDFKLITAKVLEGPFKAKISKPETGQGFEVLVVLTGGGGEKADTDEPTAKLNGKLELRSNDPLEPKLEVPLHVRRIPNRMHPRLELPNPRPGAPGTMPVPPIKKPVE